MGKASNRKRLHSGGVGVHTKIDNALRVLRLRGTPTFVPLKRYPDVKGLLDAAFFAIARSAPKSFICGGRRFWLMSSFSMVRVMVFDGPDSTEPMVYQIARSGQSFGYLPPRKPWAVAVEKVSGSLGALSAQGKPTLFSVRPGFDTPGMTEAAFSALARAIPALFVYRGRRYWLTVSLSMVRLTVFDSPDAVEPGFCCVAGGLEEFGHVPPGGRKHW